MSDSDDSAAAAAASAGRSPDEHECPEQLSNASGLDGLALVRNALKLLATCDETDGVELRRKLCLIGPHLDRIITSVQTDFHALSEQCRMATAQAQQALQAANAEAQQAQLDADLQRWHREPIKPSVNPDPHRVDWVGF